LRVKERKKLKYNTVCTLLVYIKKQNTRIRKKMTERIPPPFVARYGKTFAYVYDTVGAMYLAAIKGAAFDDGTPIIHTGIAISFREIQRLSQQEIESSAEIQQFVERAMQRGEVRTSSYLVAPMKQLPRPRYSGVGRRPPPLTPIGDLTDEDIRNLTPTTCRLVSKEEWAKRTGFSERNYNMGLITAEEWLVRKGLMTKTTAMPKLLASVDTGMAKKMQYLSKPMISRTSCQPKALASTACLGIFKLPRAAKPVDIISAISSTSDLRNAIARNTIIDQETRGADAVLAMVSTDAAADASKFVIGQDVAHQSDLQKIFDDSSVTPVEYRGLLLMPVSMPIDRIKVTAGDALTIKNVPAFVYLPKIMHTEGTVWLYFDAKRGGGLKIGDVTKAVAIYRVLEAILKKENYKAVIRAIVALRESDIVNVEVNLNAYEPQPPVFGQVSDYAFTACKPVMAKPQQEILYGTFE
jgi:hypothetical protein